MGVRWEIVHVASGGNASVTDMSVEHEVFPLSKQGNTLFLKTFLATYS